MKGSKIEWTDKTWNPTRGCEPVSPGCLNCYAMRQAARFNGPGQPYEGLVTIRDGKARWTGAFRFVPEMLAKPLTWRKPRRIFVNSMSDLFGEGVTNEEIAAVFGVMAACPQHTFQVLTKRPKRMLEWFAWADFHPHGDGSGTGCGPFSALAKALCEHPGPLPGLDYDDEGIALGQALDRPWPLPNVWLGVSVENQETADERVPLLLECPAAVRWVSAEPLLERVQFMSLPANLRNIDGGLLVSDYFSVLTGVGEDCNAEETDNRFPHLDWVVVGGESGPGARATNVEHVRSVVEQCQAARVPCFTKQLGAYPYADKGGRDCPVQIAISDRKGGKPNDWPEDLRVREWPELAR